MSTMNEKERHVKKLILGHMITLDENRPFAQAMVVRDGYIQYIGSAETARSLCDADTIVMDYGANCIYPGFMEAHCHPCVAGERLISSANLTPGKCMADYMEIMREYIARYPDKEYYKGVGWQERDRQPSAAMLDAICPNKPMLLGSYDGHSIWCNTKMLQDHHITPEYARKIGTDQIRVDQDGNPTGYISESVAFDLSGSLTYSVKEQKEQLLSWQRFAFSQGYVAVGDAAVQKINHDGYQAAVSDASWKLRTYSSCYLHESVEDVEGFIHHAAQVARECGSEYFKLIGIKVFMDGVVEAHTGWLEQDYSDQPGYHGLERYNDHDKLVRVIRLAEEQGMNVHFHAIGDGAVHAALDAIEDAQKATGNYDQRNAIAHLQILRRDDFKRLADQHVVAVVAPLWCPKARSVYPREVGYIGARRAEKSYPIGAFRKQGGVIAFHTDYPVSPEMDVPESIFRAVRRYSSKTGETSLRGKKEAIVRRDALLALTRNVAYMWHEENRMGSLEIGKIANMTIYDTDFLHADLEKIPHASLIATVVDGEEVYRKE